MVIGSNLFGIWRASDGQKRQMVYKILMTESQPKAEE